MPSYFQARKSHRENEKRKAQKAGYWRDDAFSELRESERFERQWILHSLYERQNYTPLPESRTLQDWVYAYLRWSNKEHFGTDFISRSRALNEPFIPKGQGEAVYDKYGNGWKEIIEKAIQVNPPLPWKSP